MALIARLSDRGAGGGENDQTHGKIGEVLIGCCCATSDRDVNIKDRRLMQRPEKDWKFTFFLRRLNHDRLNCRERCIKKTYLFRRLLHRDKVVSIPINR